MRADSHDEVNNCFHNVANAPKKKSTSKRTCACEEYLTLVLRGLPLKLSV
jgi:hypothetical protein